MNTETWTAPDLQIEAQSVIAAMRQAASAGQQHWLTAVLQAIGRWPLAREQVGDRTYCYLIGGEAFDWLLLAERLCEGLDGAIPAEEAEALLFFGRPPRALDENEFRRAIGDAKHRAHLNFLYGVAVEEALQLVVEEELLKEQRSLVWSQGENLEHRVFERIYGRGRDELLAAFQEQGALPPGDELSYGEWRAFTYWLFKYRVNQMDPARVASDTRKALIQVSELEAAARRRAQHVASVSLNGHTVVDGEVVARLR